MTAHKQMFSEGTLLIKDVKLSVTILQRKGDFDSQHY